MLWRGRQMDRRLGKAVAAAGPSDPGADPAWGGGPGDDSPVTEADLADLPSAVQRYLRAMGVPGRLRDWSFRAHFTGRFRLQGRGGWMPAEVWQYDTAPRIARIFHMRLDFAGFIPMVGSDTYLGGRGLMVGKLLDVITVVRSEGPETDMSELVTYLNDLVLIAPSMLLRLPVAFAPVDDDSFDVTLSDGGQTVTARVLLDQAGRPRDFVTTDRYADLPRRGLVRARWTTPIEGWAGTAEAGEAAEGADPAGGTLHRPLPLKGQAIWHLDTGALPYLTFALSPGSVQYNVPAGEVGRPARARGLA